MKFKVDENLPIEVALALRVAGHDAMSVVDQGLGGHADARIAEVCKRESRALVTLDLDFANVRGFSSRRILRHHRAETAAAGQAARARRIPTPGPVARDGVSSTEALGRG
jgi:Domain of unknown function (DUF5615)